MFTQDNTEGYSDAELDAFNREFAERLATYFIRPGSEEARELEKAFNDEVSRRS
jgi:hypothetical protein